MRGRMQELEVAARPHLDPRLPDTEPASPIGSPGVRGLNVDFELTQDGGRASVVVQQGHLELPQLFEQPRMHWTSWLANCSGNCRSDRYPARDVHCQCRCPGRIPRLEKWHTGDAADARLPGVLELQGSMSRAELVPAPLPAAGHQQRRCALISCDTAGRAGGARFQVKGDLRDFPSPSLGRAELRCRGQCGHTASLYVPTSAACAAVALACTRGPAR